MPHMVIFREADGETGYRQVDGVAEAVALVERLHNEHGIEHARIFRLEEVRYELRPYLRVEVDADLRALEAGPPAERPGPTGGARRGLFGR